MALVSFEEQKLTSPYIIRVASQIMVKEKESTVIVAVRVRPENRPVKKCLSVVNARQINVGERAFNYDYVFDEDR